MPDNTSKILNKIKGRRIIYPIAIGLAVAFYMLYKEFDMDKFSAIQFSYYSLFWLVLAMLMMAVRDLGYMLRARILTNFELSWKQSFNIIMIWEFTSAITPSMVGGTSVAILFFNKEGITVGRSSAIVLATSFLDELYFILMFPLLVFLVGSSELFTIGGTEMSGEAMSFLWIAVVGYSFKLLYTLFITYGLFLNPRGLKWLLLWIFKIPWIRKWRYKALVTGNELVNSSREMKNQPFSFWLKAFLATFTSWTARYWVVNFILLAFFPVGKHLLIFARQLVMWIMMLISPTPGGSGFAEVVFSEYLGEFIPVGLAISMALLWRFISYYPYLFIGVSILPRWIRAKFGSTEALNED